MAVNIERDFAGGVTGGSNNAASGGSSSVSGGALRSASGLNDWAAGGQSEDN
ncbi:uncharacterized protein METZ01_LOCUS188474 [marine metagenome]|uniref:Uncharacterized protein n=1 Tax=marine metagenome TaxID=408172 RepID=A0A382DB13_9ZZZZ